MSASDQPPPFHKLDHGLQSHSPPDQLLPHRSNRTKPPLKLPHKRKFFTLSMYNSADSDVDSSRNSPAPDAEFAWNRPSVQNQYPEALDLKAMPAVSCKQQLDMAIEGGSSSFLAGEEQILEKKKLLAQLTGINPGAAAGTSKAFFETVQAFHESSKVFRESSTIQLSNPCRVCRFCGREFPSGRALGGHMRVHGALLDAQLINMKQEKQIQQCEGKQQYAEKQKHQAQVKLGSKARSSVARSATPRELSQSEDCKDRDQRLVEAKRGAANYTEEAGSQFMKSDIHEKPDSNCTTLTTIKRIKEGEDDHLFNVSYSLEYHASKMDSTHIPGNELTNSALYELRRNPKPSQRFMNKEEHHVAQISHSFNANSLSTLIRAQELPPTSTAEDMQHSHSPESVHPCSECGKVFSSWKALFGHMRCHPEREWRGIQRPDGNGELDRMAKMITRRPSAEGSTEKDFDQPHQSKSNSMKLEIEEESAHSDVILDSKELIEANHSKGKCLNTKEIVDSLAKEKAASVANREGLARKPAKGVREALTNGLDCSSRKQNELGEQANIKNQSSEVTLQESMTAHSHLEAMIDDWTPSWSSAGKRSKRRRMSHTYTEPTLTSDQTTSDEIIKMDQTGYNAEEYMEDLVDPAYCLVLLSKSIPAVNKSSTAESTALFDSGKAWRTTIANVDGLERAWDDAVQYRMRDQHDDSEAEDHIIDDENDNDADQAINNGCHPVPPTLSVKYQCSTCKKCFNSHQALGGHRASHRKMKGCFARMKSLASYDAQESSEENNTDEPEYNLSFFYKKGKIVKQVSPQEDKLGIVCKDLTDKSAAKKLKGHECSICHRIFMTGQALGGHKRCHWTGEKAPGISDAASVASSSSTENRQQTSTVQEREEWGYRSNSKANEDVFDLNLPAPVEEDDEVGLQVATCGASMNAKLKPQMWEQQEWSCPAKVTHIAQVCSVKTL